MCGFVVCIGKKTNKLKLKNALLSLQHRGPDDLGIWQDEKEEVSFGHVRLSIIDLALGKQPMTNHDESLVAVVNGEFYGYRQIREELARDGYQFKTRSDSEIILGLYERYGVRALKFLRGEFAFVLWDKKNRLVFAARDYFGIKPLFYREDDGAIYFASEAKAFKELGFSLAFDEESFFQTICLFPNPETSLFVGINQVPPAHYLVRSGHGLKKVQSYWDFNYPKEEVSKNISEEEAASSLQDVLTEAIKLRLEADVPVGCYLSGGLDSCSVLGIAQKISARKIDAFTLTFDHEDYDEAEQAREMAQFVGSQWNPIPITQADLATHFEDAVWHAEKFLFNAHGVAKFLLSKAVRQAGLKVVLTGEGSDEIFGGYAHFRQDQILHSTQWTKAQKDSFIAHLRETNKVSRGLLLCEDTSEDELPITRILGFYPSWMRNFARLRTHMLAILLPDTSEKFNERNPITCVLNFLDLASQIEGRDVLSRSLYLWSKIILPYYLLTVLGDRMEMAHSIEGRLPFLDHKVVEYVVSLPSKFKIKDLTEKYILREAAKPYLTKTIYERQKHPFMAPPASLAQKNNRMSELIEDTLRAEDFKSVPFVNHKFMISMLDGFKDLSAEEQTALDPLFLTLVSASLLQKRMSS